jgi:tRNA dimethylallyltransferase
MDKIKQKLIVVVGPTASGKSDLAIGLARKLNGEVISADSRQVYRGMDIGTGKVSKREQRLVPHYLLDVASPKKIFTVADFKSQTKRVIADIVRRDKLPIIVGGTGQYIDTLVYGLALPEVPPNYKLRAKLEKQTTEQLFTKLKKLDPERADNIDRHNPRRLIRALEIIASLGKVPSFSIDYSLPPTRYDVLWLGLNPKDLDKRIALRLKKRFRQGMIAEVKKLIKNGVPLKRLYEIGLGYRLIPEYLKGSLTLKDLKKLVLISEIQYAHRQMTWFKRNPEIRWLKNDVEAMRLGRAFLGRQVVR